MITNYKARNVFYLRISPTAVLALSLRLDPRHTQWMNDDVLERILSALRGRIGPKLRKESRGAEKKTVVDVYRGATYQIAYYFRATSQKHAVLLKDRQVLQPGLPSSDESKGDANVGPQIEDPSDEIEYIKPEPTEEDEAAAIALASAAPAASTSCTSFPGVVHTINDTDDPNFEEDIKPDDLKPSLKVTYTGFSIFGRTLIVILTSLSSVEPWPALPASLLTPAPEDTSNTRQLSAAPAPHSHSRRSRSTFTSTAVGASPGLPAASGSGSGSARGLFRSPTPGSDDEDLNAFLHRSQSVVRRFEEDGNNDELPEIDFRLGNEV